MIVFHLFCLIFCMTQQNNALKQDEIIVLSWVFPKNWVIIGNLVLNWGELRGDMSPVRFIHEKFDRYSCTEQKRIARQQVTNGLYFYGWTILLFYEMLFYGELMKSTCACVYIDDLSYQLGIPKKFWWMKFHS